MAKRKVNLNWIKFITGQADASSLTSKNAARLRAKRAKRAKLIKSGRVPLKPYPSGIVGVDERED